MELEAIVDQTTLGKAFPDLVIVVVIPYFADPVDHLNPARGLHVAFIRVGFIFLKVPAVPHGRVFRLDRPEKYEQNKRLSIFKSFQLFFKPNNLVLLYPNNVFSQQALCQTIIQRLGFSIIIVLQPASALPNAHAATWLQRYYRAKRNEWDTCWFDGLSGCNNKQVVQVQIRFKFEGLGSKQMLAICILGGFFVFKG